MISQTRPTLVSKTGASQCEVVSSFPPAVRRLLVDVDPKTVGVRYQYGYCWIVSERRIMFWNVVRESSSFRTIDLPFAADAALCAVVCRRESESSAVELCACSAEGEIFFLNDVDSSETAVGRINLDEGVSGVCLNHIDGFCYVFGTSSGQLIRISTNRASGSSIVSLRVRPFASGDEKDRVESSRWGFLGNWIGRAIGPADASRRSAVRSIVPRRRQVVLSFAGISNLGSSLHHVVEGISEMLFVLTDTALFCWDIESKHPLLLWECDVRRLIDVDDGDELRLIDFCAGPTRSSFFLLVCTSSLHVPVGTSPIAYFCLLRLEVEESGTVTISGTVDLPFEPSLDAAHAMELFNHSKVYGVGSVVGGAPVAFCCFPDRVLICSVPPSSNQEIETFLAAPGEPLLWGIGSPSQTRDQRRLLLDRTVAKVVIPPLRAASVVLFSPARGILALSQLLPHSGPEPADEGDSGEEEDDKIRLVASFVCDGAQVEVAFYAWRNGDVNVLHGVRRIASTLHSIPPDDLARSFLVCGIERISRLIIDRRTETGLAWRAGGSRSGEDTAATGAMLIHHQLESKVTEHRKLLEFLHSTNLWPLLPLRTHLAICDDADKISHIYALRKHHLDKSVEHSYLNSAIAQACGPAVAGSASASAVDYFYTNVSHVPRIWQYVNEIVNEARQSHGRFAFPLVHELSTLALASLGAVLSSRAADAKLRVGTNVDRDEADGYEPWLAQRPVRDLCRGMLLAVMTTSVEDAFPTRAEVAAGLANVLCESYEEMLRWLPAAFHSEISEIEANAYGSMQHEYRDIRRSAINSLRRIGLTNEARGIAERFHDYASLMELCQPDLVGDRETSVAMVERYATEVFPPEFCDFVYHWYLSHGMLDILLSLSSWHDERLKSFLKERPALSWVHDLRIGEFGDASKSLFCEGLREKQFMDRRRILFSLAKMSHLATVGDGADVDPFDRELFLIDSIGKAGVLCGLEGKQVAELGVLVMLDKSSRGRPTPYVAPEELIDRLSRVEGENRLAALKLSFKILSFSVSHRSDEENLLLSTRMWKTVIQMDDWESYSLLDESELEPKLFGSMMFRLGTSDGAEELIRHPSVKAAVDQMPSEVQRVVSLVGVYVSATWEERRRQEVEIAQMTQ